MANCCPEKDDGSSDAVVADPSDLLAGFKALNSQGDWDIGAIAEKELRSVSAFRAPAWLYAMPPWRKAKGGFQAVIARKGGADLERGG